MTCCLKSTTGCFLGRPSETSEFEPHAVEYCFLDDASPASFCHASFVPESCREHARVDWSCSACCTFAADRSSLCGIRDVDVEPNRAGLALFERRKTTDAVQKLPLVPFAEFSKGLSGVFLELIFADRLPGKTGCCLRASATGQLDCWGGMLPESVFQVEVVEDLQTFQIRLRNLSGHYLKLREEKELDHHGVCKNHLLATRFQVSADDIAPLIQLSVVGREGACSLGIFAPRILSEPVLASMQESRRALRMSARKTLEADPSLRGHRRHREDPTDSYFSFEELVVHMQGLFPLHDDMPERVVQHDSLKPSDRCRSGVSRGTSSKPHTNDLDVLSFARILWKHAFVAHPRRTMSDIDCQTHGRLMADSWQTMAESWQTMADIDCADTKAGPMVDSWPTHGRPCQAKMREEDSWQIIDCTDFEDLQMP
eukprot:TRINITY_DN5491_c0_g1_i1.p1 TRINITY_DN5491_c0_g1~~TRINITY_DN5491_c0_g1_i1.p1  ORF type:complete len:427 (-),score=66.21 TRINITY_DN5491_c0_g1_i1:24-1304(-)